MENPPFQLPEFEKKKKKNPSTSRKKKHQSCYQFPPNPLKQTLNACDREPFIAVFNTARHSERKTTNKTLITQTYQFQCSRVPKRAIPFLWQSWPFLLWLFRSYRCPHFWWAAQMVHFQLSLRLLHLHHFSNLIRLATMSIINITILKAKDAASNLWPHNTTDILRTFYHAHCVIRCVCFSDINVLRMGKFNIRLHVAVLKTLLSGKHHHRWRHHGK